MSKHAEPIFSELTRWKDVTTVCLFTLSIKEIHTKECPTVFTRSGKYVCRTQFVKYGFPPCFRALTSDCVKPKHRDFVSLVVTNLYTLFNYLNLQTNIRLIIIYFKLPTTDTYK